MLDTWFSSALWPFATLGWPDETPELRAFYPTDVLSTGRDILFLWVARMVMMGLRFTGDIPFSDVNVHSIIQAPDGRRMSKSLGTGVDPLQLIDGGPRPPVFGTKGKPPGDFPAYGADAVRFGLLAMSSTQDVRFSEEKIAQGQALANKLYNATRFVALRVGEGVEVGRAARRRTVEDRWILSRLQAIEADTAARIDGFDFAKAALGLYDFVYGELCDWYLELVKPRLGDDADPDERAALGATLLHVLRETIATAHPIIPFVTEELWELLGYTEAEGLLAAGRLPEADDALRDPERRGRRWRRAIDADPVAAGLARLRRREGRRDRAGRPAGDGLRATRPRASPASRASRSPTTTRQRRGAGRDDRDPRRRGRRPARPTPSTSARPRQRLAQAREKLEREIARAAGKLANERLRRQGAARRSSPPSATSSSACARSWRRSPRGSRWPRARTRGDARRRPPPAGRQPTPRTGCCRSSSSACASAWIACARSWPRSARRTRPSARSTSSARTASPRPRG